MHQPLANAEGLDLAHLVLDVEAADHVARGREALRVARVRLRVAHVVVDAAALGQAEAKAVRRGEGAGEEREG